MLLLLLLWFFFTIIIITTINIITIIIMVMVIIIINHNYCCYHPDYDVVVVVGWQLSRVLFRVLSRIAWHFLEFCLGLHCLHLEWPGCSWGWNMREIVAGNNMRTRWDYYYYQCDGCQTVASDPTLEFAFLDCAQFPGVLHWITLFAPWMAWVQFGVKHEGNCRW